MGVRTRGLDIAKNAKRQVADAAARAEANAVIERWNEQLVASRDMLRSPTIRAALIAGMPWLDVFCPGCGTSRGNRSAEGRSPSARVSRNARAGTAVLMVPGIGADAADPRFARLAACGEGSGVELVSKGMRTIGASITFPRSDGKICARSRPRRSPAPLSGGQSPAWSSKEFRGRLTSTLDLGFICGSRLGLIFLTD
jgi:hypothetical protein